MNKRERTIAIAAITFVGLAVIYNFILDPVLQEWQALNTEADSKVSMLKRDIAMLGASKLIEDTYAKFSKYVKGDRSQEEAAADVLSYIEGLSRDDSCLILNIKPIGTKDYGSYSELMIDLSVEGSASQLTKFLYDIENTKQMILKVRHFILTSKAGQEGALRGSLLISQIIIE